MCQFIYWRQIDKMGGIKVHEHYIVVYELGQVSQPTRYIQCALLK